MTMTPAPLDIWSNPYQRFGFVDVNALIGDGIEPHDVQLFFGPTEQTDLFTTRFHTRTTIPQLLVAVGLFGATKEAERKGFRGPIAEGWSDFLVKQFGRKHRICILKISETKYPELDGCPCGGGPFVVKLGPQFRVGCSACHRSTTAASSRLAAINAWNNPRENYDAKGRKLK